MKIVKKGPQLSAVLLKSLDESKPAAQWEDVSVLRAWIKNPRDHKKNVAEIMTSVQTFGWGRAVTARLADKEIIAGHGAVLAAEQLGIKRIPVRYLDLEERLAHGMSLADNQIATKSTYKKDTLLEALSEQRSHIPTFTATGFKYEDFFGEKKPKPGEDDIPAAPKTPISKVGDVWKCGQHFVVCGDSFDEKVRALVLKKKLVDCVVTDPPFAIYGSSSGIGKDIADDKMVMPFFDQTAMIIATHLKEFGHAYVCCDWRSWSALWGAVRHHQLAGKNMIVWDKGNQGMGAMYQQCHELAMFLARVPPPKAMVTTTKHGHRTIHGKANVMRINRPTGEDRQHNAAKPVELFRYFIENSTDEGDTVVDFFCGSGTTLIAAEQTNRKSISFDLEPVEVDKTVLRWEAATERKAVLQ
jgi:hypothetical protein